MLNILKKHRDSNVFPEPPVPLAIVPGLQFAEKRYRPRD